MPSPDSHEDSICCSPDRCIEGRPGKRDRDAGPGSERAKTGAGCGRQEGYEQECWPSDCEALSYRRAPAKCIRRPTLARRQAAAKSDFAADRRLATERLARLTRNSALLRPSTICARDANAVGALTDEARLDTRLDGRRRASIPRSLRPIHAGRGCIPRNGDLRTADE